jgi:predicted phage-related endonuclease
MATVTEQIRKSDEWLTEYNRTIGGSSAAAVVGKSRFMTPAKLYDRMTSDCHEDLSDNPDIRRGCMFESLALELLAEDIQQKIIPHDQNKFERNPEFWFAHVLPDGRADDGTYVEAKVPRPAGVSNAILNGIPDEWHIQCQHGMAITDTEKYWICLLDVVEVRVARFLVTRDDEMIKRLMEAEAEFMSMVTRGERPEESTEAIADVGEIESSGELVVIDDAETRKLAQHYFRMRDLCSEAEAVRDAAKVRLIESSKDAHAFQVPGVGKFYHRPSKPRRSFDKERALRDFPQLKDRKYTKTGAPSRPFKAYPYNGD